MFIKVSGLLTFQCETCHHEFSASQQIRNVWFLKHTTAQVVSHQLFTAHQFFQSGLFMPKFLLIEKGSLFVPYVTAFRAEGSLKKPQNKTFNGIMRKSQ